VGATALAGFAGMAVAAATPAADFSSAGFVVLPEPKKYRNSVRFGGLAPVAVVELTAAAGCADAVAGKAIDAAATGRDGAKDTAPRDS
jgi:hypothetical protein